MSTTPEKVGIGWGELGCELKNEMVRAQSYPKKGINLSQVASFHLPKRVVVCLSISSHQPTIALLSSQAQTSLEIKNLIFSQPVSQEVYPDTFFYPLTTFNLNSISKCSPCNALTDIIYPANSWLFISED